MKMLHYQLQTKPLQTALRCFSPPQLSLLEAASTIADPVILVARIQRRFVLRMDMKQGKPIDHIVWDHEQDSNNVEYSRLEIFTNTLLDVSANRYVGPYFYGYGPTGFVPKELGLKYCFSVANS